MNTYVGDITQNYGKEHNVVVTNANGTHLLNNEVLPNTLFISAPTDASKTDIGFYGLYHSDSKGNAIRLTYTLALGDGFDVNGSGDDADIVSLHIDHSSIGADGADGLHVQLTYIIDNDESKNDGTLNVVQKNGRDVLKVIANNLDQATDITYGVVKGDNNTINLYNGTISVVTNNLDYADDDTATNGIIKSDASNHISLKNGVLFVNSENLAPASSSTLGVVKPDNNFTFVDSDGTLRIKNYTYASSSVTTSYNASTGVTTTTFKGVHGIVMPDYYTTRTDTDGKLRVITSGLQHAVAAVNEQAKTTEEIGGEYGVVKPDGYSLKITKKGLLEVVDYGIIKNIMDNYTSDYNDLSNRIRKLEDTVNALMNMTSNDYIKIEVDKTTDKMSEPVYSSITQSIIDKEENIAFQMYITTNCTFKISITYENNENPAVALASIQYGEAMYNNTNYTTAEFQSTNDTVSTLIFNFKSRNFNNDKDAYGCIDTKINVAITSINDGNINSTRTFIITRYNMDFYKDLFLVSNIDAFDGNKNYILETDGIKSLTWKDSIGDVLTKTTNLKYSASTTSTAFLQAISENVTYMTSTKNEYIYKQCENINKTLATVQEHKNAMCDKFKVSVMPTNEDVYETVFGLSKLINTNKSLGSVGVLTSDKLELIAADTSITNWKDLQANDAKNNKEIYTAVSSNAEEIMGKFYNVNLNNYAISVNSLPATSDYLKLKIVSDFTPEYQEKIINNGDTSIIGEIKTIVSTYCSYYVYSDGVGVYKTSPCTNFITVSNAGLSSDNYNQIIIKDTVEMPSNIAYRDAIITFETYGDIITQYGAGRHSSQSKTINYREYFDSPTPEVNLTSVIDYDTKRATTQAVVSDNTIRIYDKSNTETNWNVDLTYKYAICKNKIWSYSLPNTLTLNFENSNTSKTVEIPIINESIKNIIFDTSNFNTKFAKTPNIKTWIRKNEPIVKPKETMVFNDAFVSSMQIIHNEGSNNYKAIFTILPGAKTTIKNKAIINIEDYKLTYNYYKFDKNSNAKTMATKAIIATPTIGATWDVITGVTIEFEFNETANMTNLCGLLFNFTLSAVKGTETSDTFVVSKTGSSKVTTTVGTTESLEIVNTNFNISSTSHADIESVIQYQKETAEGITAINKQLETIITTSNANDILNLGFEGLQSGNSGRVKITRVESDFL